MGGDHYPRPTTTLRAQVLHDGLEVQHQTTVLANESSHLVHQEDQTAAILLFVEVFLHVLAKGFDAQGEVVLGIVHPLLARLLGLPESLAESLHHFVAVKLIGIPLAHPGMAGEVFIFLMEGVQLALAVQVPLHVGDVWVLGAIPLHFVEHLQEHRQDRFSTGLGVSPTVDVEQDHVSVAVHCFLDVRKHQRVLDLLLEELDRLLRIAFVLVQAIPQHIAQDLDEVRFTGAEEARDPDADLARDVDILRVVDPFDVRTKELLDVAVQFTGHHELIQFLPYRGLIDLIGFHNAVDWSKDVFGE